MTEYIVEYPNTISEFICEDIIDFFTEDNTNTMFEIPKNKEQYSKIEKLLYTQLLMKIQDYKSRLINYPNTNEKNKMTNIFNNKVYTKSFVVKKYGGKEEEVNDFNNNNYNRYTFLNYILYLNVVDTDKNNGEIIFDNGIIIKPNIGKLVLFPENIHCKYKYMVPTNIDNEFQYILSGQLSYNDNF